MKESAFFRLLRKRLPLEEVVALRDGLLALPPESYDPAIKRALQAALDFEAQLRRNESRVEKLYEDQRQVPSGRLRLLMDNSPPPLLLILARRCFRESYGQRFDNQPQSLALAELGLRAAMLLREPGYLSAELQADLEAEAWLYLGNARRINSDLRGAEQAFAQTAKLLSLGTGDRLLRASVFHLQASLRFSQGRSEEAAALYDQEIRLRRLLNDPEALGTALIDRGTVASWSESIETACAFLSEGVALVDDDNDELFLLALGPIADRLARDGEGLAAFRVICRAEMIALFAESSSHLLRLRWAKGIAYRALGELEGAAKELRAVQQQLVDDGLTFRAALASLDLAAVYAAQGKAAQVREVAEDAYAVFQAEGLDERALAAAAVFQRSAIAEEVTEQLAVHVANFIVGSQYNRTLTLELPRGAT